MKDKPLVIINNLNITKFINLLFAVKESLSRKTIVLLQMLIKSIFSKVEIFINNVLQKFHKIGFNIGSYHVFPPSDFQYRIFLLVGLGWLGLGVFIPLLRNISSNSNRNDEISCLSSFISSSVTPSPPRGFLCFAII